MTKKTTYPLSEMLRWNPPRLPYFPTCSKILYWTVRECRNYRDVKRFGKLPHIMTYPLLNARRTSKWRRKN